MDEILNSKILLDNEIKIIENIRLKYPKMDSREQIAICVYLIVYEILEELAEKSNATETIFVREIQQLCKRKIEYYDSNKVII